MAHLRDKSPLGNFVYCAIVLDKYIWTIVRSSGLPKAGMEANFEFSEGKPKAGGFQTEELYKSYGSLR